MSGARALVDWGLAERTAGAMIAGLGPLVRPATAAPELAYGPAEVEAACAEAIVTAAAYAGLGPVTEPPVPELLERRAWARNALATLAQAAQPLERRIAAELDLPGPLGTAARSLAGAAVGVEAGLAVGWAARRVIGQYDLALFGPPRAARLLFVAENMAQVRRELDADPKLFLSWVALHESTHVIQFERVDWLAGHLRDLARELLDAAAKGLDAGALRVLARRLVREPREVLGSGLRGELARLLADPGSRATFERLQATMSMVEGHAEHVMDAAGEQLGPQLGELRRRLDLRRARRGGLGDVVGRLLGLDLKLRQYELGKGFCDAVVAARGPEALRLAWRSPEHLPMLGELERPRAWLERVGESAPARA